MGQVEIIFSMLISAYFFKEKLARAEHLGIVLVVIAAFLVIWAWSLIFTQPLSFICNVINHLKYNLTAVLLGCVDTFSLKKIAK